MIPSSEKVIIVDYTNPKDYLPLRLECYSTMPDALVKALNPFVSMAPFNLIENTNPSAQKRTLLCFFAVLAAGSWYVQDTGLWPNTEFQFFNFFGFQSNLIMATKN